MTEYVKAYEDHSFAATDRAEETYNAGYPSDPPFKFHTKLDVRSEPIPEGQTHRHVAIEWEGGVLWLNMSVQSDHYCIDVRQFNEDGEMKGQGAFAIVNGQRQSLGKASLRTEPDGKWKTYRESALADKDNHKVTGHGWNGGYTITLMTDLHGEEQAKSRPKQGNG